MRQQLCDGRHLVCRQTLQHVFHVGVGIVAIESGRVHERHHGRRSLSGAQAACKEPVVFSDRDWTNLPAR